MLYRDENSFEKVKQALEIEDPWTELLINNFDRLIVFTLPYFACQSKMMLQTHDDEAEQEQRKRQGKLAYEFLEKKLTREVF